MIAGVSFGDGSVLAACLPVKLTGVNDYAAKRSAVTADELCSGMYYYISAVFDRADKIRSTEGVVDNQR